MRLFAGERDIAFKTMVGYGVPGSGATGTLAPFTEAAVRLKANNQFDAESASLARVVFGKPPAANNWWLILTMAWRKTML